MIDFAEFEIFLSYIFHILLMLTCLYEDLSKLIPDLLQNHTFHDLKSSVFHAAICDYLQNKLSQSKEDKEEEVS